MSKSGNYTIRLDVIDWVGRMSSSNATIFVTNVAPIIDLQLEGSSVSNPKHGNLCRGDELELVAIQLKPEMMMNHYHIMVFRWRISFVFHQFITSKHGCWGV